MGIKKGDHLWITVVDQDGGSIKSQTVEANLLYEILQKLKDLENALINIEISNG